MRGTRFPSAPRALVLAVAFAVAIGGTVGVAPAQATALTPTTTSISQPDLNPKPVGRTTIIPVSITPTVTGGTVEFFDGLVSLGTMPVQTDGTGSHSGLPIPTDFAEGTYSIVARYSGDASFEASQSTTLVFVVGPRPTIATIMSVTGPRDSSGLTAQAHDTIQVSASVTDSGVSGTLGTAPTGTFDIKVDGVTKASYNPAFESSTSLDTGTWSLGEHDITAVFNATGTDYASSAPSSAWIINIVANVVEATGLAASNPTFYPYKDGYKDTTSLRGTRAEPASVAVKVVNSSSKTVKSASVPLGTGAWSVPWNGRTSTGAMLPAGTYTVRQTVTDAHGATKTFTTSVKLSAKRLYSYTKTYKKTVSDRSAGSPSKGWIGWKFSLPSATVYKKVVFAVYGKSGSPRGVFGPHDYSVCPSATAWNWQCTNPYATFPSSWSWKSVTGSVTRNRHGTTVRMYAIAGNRTAVQYGRVTVTYGVLK